MKSRPARTRYRRVAAAAGTAIVLLLIAGPVMAELVLLTKIPLGHGTATITWVGKSGVSPTIASIGGKADGYQVKGSGKEPSPGQKGFGSGTGSLPPLLPLATVKGTLGGSPFTLKIGFQLSGAESRAAGQPVGTATGTFRGQAVQAILVPGGSKTLGRFSGTIGTLKISGVIGEVTHHGNSSTAHATFTVSK